ncbi:MAG: transaldolase [Clostridiales bacterium]|nr:transaldolase [Clostridiales bacterium]
MNDNRIKRLGEFDQSIWLDYIRRDMITGGNLRKMIEEDGLKGMTSNPAIFEKAITGSRDYDEDISRMAAEGKDCTTIYETLSQSDVRAAADEFRGVYDSTDGRDGYVSLEVNPHLAHDSKGTMTEARRLWTALGRKNVCIKLPATLEGLEAIRQLTGEGININVTLLFGLSRYRQAAEAYIEGLEGRMAQGKSLREVASVASFFISRIDTMVDPMLEKTIAAGGEEAKLASQLRGEVAVSCARMAYRIYKELFEGERFKKLAALGARPQRLLWASTGTKNPSYSDVKYIEELIGPETVNTAPLETLEAYRGHGEPEARLENGMEKAEWVLSRLPELGINMEAVSQKLEAEGIEKFNQPFDQLMKALEEKI